MSSLGEMHTGTQCILGEGPGPPRVDRTRDPEYMGPGPPGEWGPSPRVDGARVDKGRSLGGLGPGPQVYGARSSGWLRGEGPAPLVDGARAYGWARSGPPVGRGPCPQVGTPLPGWAGPRPSCGWGPPATGAHFPI